MKWLLRRIIYLYPDGLRREFGDEMEEVLLERHRELRRRGRFTALRAFWLREGIAAVRARSVELARRLRAGSVIGDLKVSVRALTGSPGFSLAAVLLLSLAVGTSTAVFSVTEAVLLAPLPFAEPDDLVLLYETNPERGWTRAQVAPANFLDWRERSTKLASMTAYNDFLTELVLERDGEPVRVRASRVFGNFFDVLGVRLLAGRGFTEEESYRGSDRVAVLSTAMSRSHFGGDRSIVGQTIVLEGESYLVVGLAPASLRLPFEDTDLWLPMGWDVSAREDVSFRRAHLLRAVGRLAPGASSSEAESELAAVASELERVYPDTNTAMGVGLMPLGDWVVGDVRTPVLVVTASALLVLLVACANVSSLFLVRFGRREAEMSLRAALGAGGLALARLAAVESALIALASGALGLLFARSAIPVLAAMAPPGIPRLDAVGIHPIVLAFALAATFSTAALCGLVPALRAARSVRPARRLTPGSRSTSSSGRLLVAIEITLAVMLSMAAVLLGRSFENARRVDPGFDLSSVTTATLRLPSHRYPTPEEAITFSEQLLERVRALPGVGQASLAGRALFDAGWSSDFTTDTWGPEQYGVSVQHRQVAPDYFETLGVPLVAGRVFSARDVIGTPPVVVVNEALAAYFPGEDPVGKRICYDRVPDERSYWRTIVGVVGNERHGNLLRPADPMFIEPMFQGEIGRTLFLHVRHAPESHGDRPLGLRELVAELDPTVPVYAVERGEAVLERRLVRERFLLTLMGLFALAGLLLSIAGMYGVLSFAVTQREKELSVRVALGARAGHIVRLVVDHGLWVALGGTLGGVALAVVLGRLVESLLYGVAPTDPATVALVVALVLSTSILASLGPALRAARVDPAQSIKNE